MNLLERRVLGFRLVDLIGFGLLLGLVMSVYLAKTIAGGERAEIASVERQIGLEQERIRLLRAEVSHLEQPARLQHLSRTYLNMAPVPAQHELSPDALEDLARAAHPKPEPVS